MDSIFLSIVIPVYGVEKYLNQCVDSVLSQHLDHYEIILVDDGSPDRCPQICDDYAERYQEIHVIHQKNKGLSTARNVGISTAKGMYIMFLDADDWWNPEVNVRLMLDVVRSKHDVDMFLFSGYDYYEGDGYYERNDCSNFDRISVENPISYYRSLLALGNMQISAATKILRASFLTENQLFFKDGITGEDNLWMIQVLRSVKRVDTIFERLYIYRGNRQDSISNTIKEKNVADLLFIVASSLDYWNKQLTINNDLRECELDYCSYLWYCALALSSRLREKEKKCCIMNLEGAQKFVTIVILPRLSLPTLFTELQA